MKKRDRVGEIGYNKFGTKMIIIEYKNYENTQIEFQDEYKVRIHTQYGNYYEVEIND